MKTRAVHLISRPNGWPEPGDFALVETETPAVGDGEALVRNTAMSVDPYMRGRMSDVPSYAPPYELNQPMTGGAIGEVIESRAPGLSAGDLVLHDHGWREHAVAPASHLRPVRPLPGVPPTAYLGALGMPGMTAYVGLLDVAGLKEGDRVFVSGAAGAVGSAAGQIARLRGASRVIGSAGTDEKVAYLTDRLGFDAAFNYRSGPAARLLREAAPDGIDVYFDNVGGEQLEAALGALNLHGRVAICGGISGYNETKPPPGPRNLSALFIRKRLSMRGFLVTDYAGRFDEFAREVGGWVRDGRLTFEETVVDGIEHAVEAFLAMLRGVNTGKMLVRL